LEYPQVDDQVIEAVGATLAPFINREKPQLSPRPAASFIKNGLHFRGLCIVRRTNGAARFNHWRMTEIEIMPNFIGLLSSSLAAQQRQPCQQKGFDSACTQWRKAAQSGGKSA
jgi:hypothetical protein